jgi:hypothetical protein
VDVKAAVRTVEGKSHLEAAVIDSDDEAASGEVRGLSEYWWE